MKRVILTGGAGFIGANLARRLVSEGHEVHLLLKPGYDAWRLRELLDQVCIFEIDLEDQAGINRVVSAVKPEWIFHLAAHGSYPHQRNPFQMVKTNILGLINLVSACCAQGFETFVNTGSSSEYGYKGHPPKETEFIEPNSHYAWTKASATHYCRYIALETGFYVPTLRLYSAYGPYEEPGRLIPTLIHRGIHGEWPPLVNPTIARDFVFVDDVCNAFLAATARSSSDPGPVYNVGTGVQTTLMEAVAVVRKRLNIAADPTWGSMSQRSWDTDVWVCDPSKIQAELGWSAGLTFEEGFALSVEWFRENPDSRAIYNSHRY